MKLHIGLLGLAASVSLSGCIYISTQERAPTVDDSRGEFLGAEVTADDTIVLVARSNGCTAKGDFRHHVSRRDGVSWVSFVRSRPDTCKAYVRDGVEITYNFAELGLASGDRVSVAHYPQC
jgi:hypothetical protein